MFTRIIDRHVHVVVYNCQIVYIYIGHVKQWIATMYPHLMRPLSAAFIAIILLINIARFNVN